MRRLLNTFPPTRDYGRASGHDHVDAEIKESATDATSSSHCTQYLVEPIRDIRFEDSPPAAVEAVVRFIYLGQKPAMEPICGYSVKQLMALSSFLEIECLQNHCVDLVLGRSRELDDDGRSSVPLCAISGSDDRSWTKTVSGQPSGRLHHLQQLQAGSSRTTASCHYKRISRVSVENLVRVLFDWGYRFPRIRCAVIQALLHDYGHIFADPGARDASLGRFKSHEAYDEILCELVEEQLGIGLF
ncbi:hypothetical protein BGX28_003787 [Mortierella sp. GBA30]|nr:hypothetical protein BGX28_003787 [Mortierella sp. GBA30]